MRVGFKEWVMGGRRNGWFAKVDNGFESEKWLQGAGVSTAV